MPHKRLHNKKQYRVECLNHVIHHEIAVLLFSYPPFYQSWMPSYQLADQKQRPLEAMGYSFYKMVWVVVQLIMR